MNPRSAITFLRSPTGVFLSFVALLIFALVFVKGFYDPNKHKPMAATPLSQAEKTNRTSQVLQTIQHEMVPFKPPRASSAPMASSVTGSDAQQVNARFTPISLYSDSMGTDPEHKPLSKFYAPYGG